MRPILKEGLSIRQRQSLLAVEEISRQYEKETGSSPDIIRPIVHVFASIIGHLILTFDKTYKNDIFDKLDMNQKEFYSQILSSKQTSSLYYDKMIPCFLLKDFYDGNLDKAKAGGSGAMMLREIDTIGDSKEEEVRELCISMAGAYIDASYLSMRRINYAVNRNFDCSMITASDEEVASINSEVLRDIFRGSIDAVVYHLRNEYKMNDNFVEESPKHLDESWISVLEKKKVSFDINL